MMKRSTPMMVVIEATEWLSNRFVPPLAVPISQKQRGRSAAI
jgi:hypothetical protein